VGNPYRSRECRGDEIKCVEGKQEKFFFHTLTNILFQFEYVLFRSEWNCFTSPQIGAYPCMNPSSGFKSNWYGESNFFVEIV